LKKQAEEPVLFLDETNHGPSVADPLRAQGYEVVCLNEEFPLGTKDEDWIPHVARRGWVILTRDRAQDINDLELLLLYRYAAKRYLIAGAAALTGRKIAERIISHYYKIVNTHTNQPAPFVYSIFEDRMTLSLSKRKMRDRLRKAGLNP
jgi:hypothetical protein